ncbi:hypothetical protein PS6_009738 [Mucor atramentarius]
MSRMQSFIATEVCITRVYFIVVPEVPHLYSDLIEGVLLNSIILMKFKLEASNIKRLRYIYDVVKRFLATIPLLYKPINGYLKRTVAGGSLKLMEKLRAICQDSVPLSNLVHHLSDLSNIDKVNCVYQFLAIDTSDTKFEETILRFHFSESALSLLRSMFPQALHKFTMLCREPKTKAVPEEDVADVLCLNLENWYNSLYKKYEQLFYSKSGQQGTLHKDYG